MWTVNVAQYSTKTWLAVVMVWLAASLFVAAWTVRSGFQVPDSHNASLTFTYLDTDDLFEATKRATIYCAGQGIDARLRLYRENSDGSGIAYFECVPGKVPDAQNAGGAVHPSH